MSADEMVQGRALAPLYTTADAAARIGVSKNTLLRWISDGRLRDVARDWRNWRVWTDEDVERARLVRDKLHGAEPVAREPKPAAMPKYAADLSRLAHGRQFRSAETGG